MVGLDLSKHHSLISSQYIDSICSPALNSIGITYFNYIKIHHVDSSRELLTNNAQWIDHFYKNELYKSVGAVDIEHLLPKGYFLWSELNSDDPVYSQGKESFNIDNGISFVVKRKDVTYLYIFASTRENTQINNFYIRNIDLLKRFILYFNDKASALMKLAEKNKIYLPEKQIILPDKSKQVHVSQAEREKFYKSTCIEKYYLLSESDDLYLTKKQAECVAYLIEGATAKQCANALNISYRTVESYINDIKNRIYEFTGKRFTKETLIQFLKNTSIYDAIFPEKMKFIN
jgi:hypothetical protein